MSFKIRKLSKKFNKKSIAYKKKGNIKHNKTKKSKQKRVKGGRNTKRKFRQEEDEFLPENTNINNIPLANYEPDQEGAQEALERVYTEERAQSRAIGETQRNEHLDLIMTELNGIKDFFSDKFLVSPLNTTFRNSAEKDSFLNRYRMDLDKSEKRLNRQILELGISQNNIHEFTYVFNWIAGVNDSEEDVENNISEYEDLFSEMIDSPNLYSESIENNGRLISIVHLLRNIDALKNAIHTITSER